MGDDFLVQNMGSWVPLDKKKAGIILKQQLQHFVNFSFAVEGIRKPILQQSISQLFQD